jgi:hypothetical protein
MTSSHSGALSKGYRRRGLASRTCSRSSRLPNFKSSTPSCSQRCGGSCRRWTWNSEYGVSSSCGVAHALGCRTSAAPRPGNPPPTSPLEVSPDAETQVLPTQRHRNR